MHKHTFRIAILLDNKARELGGILLLQKTLQGKIHAQVKIMGSIAERVRTYHFLYTFQPHIVLLSQAVEDSMREFSQYITLSGGKVFLLPSEITIMRSLSKLIINPQLHYNDFVKGIFLPGKRMSALYRKTDLSEKKLHIVGSPKIDVLIQEKGNEFLSRKMFLKKIGAPIKGKNIYIFTSFVPIDEDYLEKNLTFRSNKRLLVENNHYIQKTKDAYLRTIEQLCYDFPQYTIIHKPHPLERSTFLKKIHASNFFTAEHVTFNQCIKSIDLAVHWSSTVATECWIKRITTLQYIPVSGKDHFLSEFSPGNPIAHTYHQLYLALKKYLRAPLEKKYTRRQLQYLQDNYYRIDGKSVNRIASIIKKEWKQFSQDISYQKNFSSFYSLFMILEHIVGKKLSRRIAGFFNRNYNWKYAVQNIYDE